MFILLVCILDTEADPDARTVVFTVGKQRNKELTKKIAEAYANPHLVGIYSTCLYLFLTQNRPRNKE